MQADRPLLAEPPSSDDEEPGHEQEDGEDVDGDGDGDEDGDEGEQVEETGDAQTAPKPKRIIKQRQSLADKQPGTTIFPIARVKRIIKADQELDNLQAEAVFIIAVATEYFIKHFMEEGYTRARLDNRKIVNYRDMAAVVARQEEFDFLRDVVPMPMALSEAIEARKNRLVAQDDEHATEGDALPPLEQSTNPMYPGAVMKKAQKSGKRRESGVEESTDVDMN